MTFQLLRLLNFKDGHMNFATPKMSILRHKSERFLVLFTTIAKRPCFNVRGFLDPSLDRDGFVF